jgi:hypothetical protein
MAAATSPGAGSLDNAATGANAATNASAATGASAAVESGSSESSGSWLCEQFCDDMSLPVHAAEHLRTLVRAQLQPSRSQSQPTTTSEDEVLCFNVAQAAIFGQVSCVTIFLRKDTLSQR